MYKIWVTLAALYSLQGTAQVDCKTTDINKVKGQWVWEKKGFGNQWTFGEPLRKELLRMMPQAIDGLHATHSIAFGDKPTFFHSKSPAYYEYYLKLKKYECLPGYNKIQPEGVTGCWVYFVVNSIGANFSSLPGSAEMNFYQNAAPLYVTHIEIETDAAGNRILYTSHRPGERKIHGWYFSNRPGLPVRKLTRKEVFTSYKVHHEKRVNEQITKFEKLVTDDEKKYNSLSPAQKKEQNYWPDIIRKNKDYLAGYTAEKNKILNWYNEMMKQPGLDEIAAVQEINPFHFYPERLTATAGTGYPVWMDNPAFFDNTKPKDQPQCILLFVQKEDDQLPKKNFMDLFFSRFNLDVLCQMVGEAPKKTASLNTLSASLGEAKAEIKEYQKNAGPLTATMDASVIGTYPAGWQGMNNISVQSFENKPWLAMNKNGYWFPRQYNKEIKDGFSLTWELAWDKTIPYNSGLFTVTLSEMSFDNAAGSYKMDNNQSMYRSMYDSYVGNFNRVVLWFDPYWNSGGTLTVYSYNKQENIGVNKRIVLPDFYMSKNRHRVKLQRSGNTLQVYINNKMEASIDNVFLPAVRYNLFTFSRYKGTEEKADVFYLDDIKAQY
jgi:hypothetical protein